MMITEAQNKEMQEILARHQMEYRSAVEPVVEEHIEYATILVNDFKNTFTQEIITAKILASKMAMYEVMKVARSLQTRQITATRKVFFPDDYPG